MHHHYEDIRSRIDQEPLWFDEYAVPRYCKFRPDEAANIYAREVILMEIECQNCGHKFNVCMSWHPYLERRVSFSELAKNPPRMPHYGDPPNGSCCLAGPTMNSVAIKVLEFWVYTREGFDWEQKTWGQEKSVNNPSAGA